MNQPCFSQENNTQTIANSEQAHALWKALHKKLEKLGKKRAEHEKLPKNSLIPFKRDQKNNAKKLRAITEELLSELEISNLDPILKERQALQKNLQKNALQIIKAKEDMIGAPVKGGLFKKSRQDYQNKILKLQKKIKADEDQLKQSVEKIHVKFVQMGLRIQKRQVEDLFTVVSGNTMRTFLTRFSNLRLLSDIIAYLIQENQNTQGYANQAKRYYAIYVALVMMMIESHQDALQKIEKEHIPYIDQFKQKIETQLQETKSLAKADTNTQANTQLQNNIKIQQKLISASQSYKQYLQTQQNQIQTVLKGLQSQFDIALNTYQTISLAHSLIGEIQKGVKDIQNVHALQIPKMIPISDEKLQSEFELLGGHLPNKDLSGWNKK